MITPTNGIVDIEKKSSFSKINLQSDSFSLENGGSIVLKVSPIGEDADLDLESTAIFQTQLSSKVNLGFPIENIDINKKANLGIVQLVSIQGDPIESSQDMRIKISSSNDDIIITNQDAIISKGNSYGEFPIETKGAIGTSTISASAKGVVGAEQVVEAVTSSSSLTVSTSGVVEPIPVNEEILVKIFVDDANTNAITGATVHMTPNANVTLNTKTVRTGADGSATFALTALNGPIVSVDFQASSPGYQASTTAIDLTVDTPPGGVVDVLLPTELVYVIIGGIGVVIVVVVLFLKKSKEPIDEEEEPWEDADI